MSSSDRDGNADEEEIAPRYDYIDYDCDTEQKQGGEQAEQGEESGGVSDWCDCDAGDPADTCSYCWQMQYQLNHCAGEADENWDEEYAEGGNAEGREQGEQDGEWEEGEHET